MAQQEIINVLLDQMNTMNIIMNSMKLAITQSLKPSQHAPLLAIGNTAIDDSEDIPAPVAGLRSRQIDENGTLIEASAAKKPNNPNKNNPKPTERQKTSSTSPTNG